MGVIPMAGGQYEKGLFRQLQETIDRLDREEKQHKEDIRKAADNHQQRLDIMEAAHRQETAQLRQMLEAQSKVIAQLEKDIQLLREDNERLRSILNNDSNNSSQPPSTDQKGKRTNTYNGRMKSERSKGAQPGHHGTTLTRKDVEERIAARKLQCKSVDHGQGPGKAVVKYVLDICITSYATKHRFYPDSTGKYSIPVELRSDVTYGETIRALAIQLYGVGVVSNERIQSFIDGITQGEMKPSAGGIYGIIRRFSDSICDEMGHIAKSLLNQKVLYTDCTNISIDAKQAYIRNLSTRDEVLYSCMQHKDLESLREMDVLPEFAGILTHDHETALYHFGTQHGECNVHLLRHLTKNTEDTGHRWSEAMREFLCNANQARKRRILNGSVLTREELTKYSEAYDGICTQGELQNVDCSPKWAKKQEKALLRRLRAYKENHLLFLYDNDVAFDNNLSERDLRKCKSRQKMSGGFRNLEGAQMYSRILSLIETCKRRNRSPLSAILAVLRGKKVWATGG
jgi:transposase